MMKTLQTIIILLVLLLDVSVSAFYSFQQTVTRSITTEAAPTVEQAYQLGKTRLAKLHDSTTSELEQMLIDEVGVVEANTLHIIDEGSVSIQERMGIDRELSYVGVVKVDVSFVPHEYDD
ncbi:DUF3316 domain-containing protein [Leucothrix pacifica]|uniref:Uncharacterized protein n=1 Tax=Leucothrix pacifica TaxID=1247513 RepID=A0A317C2F1_9GAMM|nr:DUF3316 domain-containing protein [Leucothrix pacifica]PWQ92805.1 hypothetical protein DKW60_19545 [Leucothrix pacifica]